jgi:hypothetical protein
VRLLPGGAAAAERQRGHAAAEAQRLEGVPAAEGGVALAEGPQLLLQQRQVTAVYLPGRQLLRQVGHIHIVHVPQPDAGVAVAAHYVPAGDGHHQSSSGRHVLPRQPPRRALLRCRRRRPRQLLLWLRMPLVAAELLRVMLGLERRLLLLLQVLLAVLLPVLEAGLPRRVLVWALLLLLPWQAAAVTVISWLRKLDHSCWRCCMAAAIHPHRRQRIAACSGSCRGTRLLRQQRCRCSS